MVLCIGTQIGKRKINAGSTDPFETSETNRCYRKAQNILMRDF